MTALNNSILGPFVPQLTTSEEPKAYDCYGKPGHYPKAKLTDLEPRPKSCTTKKALSYRTNILLETSAAVFT